MKEKILLVIIIVVMVYGGLSLLGLVVGLLDGALGNLEYDTKTKTFKTEHCEYRSWAARTNIGYIAGCEYFKPRFKE